MSEIQPTLRLYLETERPIEVADFSAAINSIARQYEAFASRRGIERGAENAKLLVSSVQPGSIDISFITGWPEILGVAVSVQPALEQIKIVNEFANHLRYLLEKFLPKKKTTPVDTQSVRDCEDAINIVKPTAQGGGSQSILVIKDSIINIKHSDAKEIIGNATRVKRALENPKSSLHEHVAMIWKRLDRDPTKSQRSSPDKAQIDSIDRKAKPVFFVEPLKHLKQQMIEDETNSYQQVYFVDVYVNRIDGRAVSYKVVGYHGKDALDPEDS
jgi:hypothetical protein